MSNGRRRRGSKSRRPEKRAPDSSAILMGWMPKTRLGHLVKSKEISTMSDALNSGLPIREQEIIDVLLSGMEDEVIDVNMVQRMTDSGRRIKFVITVAVGNNDGFIGLGQAKGKEVGSSIKKAIDTAKLNIIEIRRGCGSWECGCGKAHTLPFVVKGKSGSVEVTFKPAPHGIGLATGDVAKKILKLAGVQDCWAFTRGKTKTVVNYAKAVFNALEQNAETRITQNEIKNLGIISGGLSLPPTKEEKPVESEVKIEEKKPESAPPKEEKPVDVEKKEEE